MTEVLETAGKYRVRLEIQGDQQDANPRIEQDTNLANVITPAGQRYIEVDKDGGPLQDRWDRIGWDRAASRDAVADVFARWAKIFHGAVVIEDRPHDGAWSIWYVMPDRLAETTWTAEKVIEAEISEYRQWAAGEVYGYIIEKRVHWVSEDHGDAETDTWEEVESCWGYIGREYAEEEARREFELYAKETNE